MSLDYRDIRITVDQDKYVLIIEYKGGGGLRLPFNRLEINYPSLFRGDDGQHAGQMVFEKRQVCK